MAAQDRYLFLFLKAAPCSCRCMHCDFAASGGSATLPSERVVEFVQPFIEARREGAVPYRKLSVLVGDAPLNHPDLAMCVEYLKRNGIEGWRSLSANGISSRRLDEWRPFLESVRSAGTEFLEFTLYGRADTHDWFARRSGDHDHLHSLARAWRDLGGKAIWFVLVHKKNLHDTRDIQSEIQDTYGDRCAPFAAAYLGNAAKHEDLRLDEADLDSLDEMTKDALGDLRPERQWAEELASSEDNPYPATPPVIRVAVEADGTARIPYTPAPGGHNGVEIGKLPLAEPGAFIDNWLRAYEAWRGGYPSLRTLSQSYGDRSETKLYDLSSIKAKWCSKHDLATEVR